MIGADLLGFKGFNDATLRIKGTDRPIGRAGFQIGRLSNTSQ